MAGTTASRALRSPATTGVRLALPSDDVGLRQLLRRSAIPGAVRVAFTREPAYDAGAGVAGADDVTVLHEHDGYIDAMGRCSIRDLHRNGIVRRIGYLAELRAAGAVPLPRTALREGYARLADWSIRRGAEGFVTSVADDNVRARRVLERGGRLGLPAYRPLGALVTFLAPVLAGAGGREAGGAPVSPEELGEFLRRHACRAQLTLPWTDRYWRALAVHGVTSRDFAVVQRDGRIVAAAGVWDQRAFRQTVIDGVSGPLRLLRPAVNVARRLRGRPPLPGPGEVLAQGALLAVSVDEARDWLILWPALQALAAARGLSWLSLSLDRRDPWCSILRALTRPREYFTTLYEVRWQNQPTWSEAWDGRLLRPEVGLL